MTGPAPEAAAVRASLAWVALAVLVACLAHASGLGNDFVNYDDPQVNEAVASKSPLELATSVTYFGWQPVYFLSLQADRAVFGPGPLGPHLGSWALFALCAGCLAVLLAALTRSAFVGGAAALLFAAHPVHAESVAWAAERKDVLSLAFVLLAHLAYRRARARTPLRPSVLAAVLFVLGGLSKPSVWTYGAVFAIDEALERRPGALRRLLLPGLLAVAGAAVQMWVAAKHGPGAVEHDATSLELAAAMAGSHLRYLLHLVWPAGLSVDYAVDPRGAWGDPFAVLGLLLALAALAGLVVGVRRRRPVLALACGLWLAGLLPFNNLLPKTTTLLADRYLIVPAVGLYLLVAAALSRVRVPSFRMGALAAAVAALAVLASIRGRAFASSDALWTDAVSKQPGSAVAWLNRGVDRQDRADWAGAEADAGRAVEAAKRLRRPELAVQAHRLRSVALLALAQAPGLDAESRAGRLAEALAEADAAVEGLRGLRRTPWVKADPRRELGNALVQRGDVLHVRGDVPGAASAYREAAGVLAEHFDAQWKLGNVLAVSPRGEDTVHAAAALARAHRMRPEHLGATIQLLGVLTNLQRDAEWDATFQGALRVHGPHPELRLARAQRLLAAKDAAGAIAEAEAVLVAHRGNEDALRFLAAVHLDQGALAVDRARRTRSPEPLREAVTSFDRAAEILSQSPLPLVKAGDASLGLGDFSGARRRYRSARARPDAPAWITGLEGRAAVLEAATLARGGKESEAAAVLGEALRDGVRSLDVGFQALDEEALRLLPAARALEGGSPVAAALAPPVLAGAALLVGGDEDGARAAFDRAIGSIATPPAPGSAEADVLFSAHLLRALGRARRTDLDGARVDLAAAERARPRDPLAAYHRVALDHREAAARRSIALGASDAAAVATADAALAEAEKAVAALADANPGWPQPALLAADLEIGRGDVLAALRRLNGLERTFPADPSVHRGIASIYLRRSLESAERPRLLAEAIRALGRARELDERDPRVALDLSSAYRLAGDLQNALVFATRAAELEPVRGEAARVLSALLVDRARKDLERGAADAALDGVQRARIFDPASAAPDLVEGEVWRGRRDYEKALRAFERARDKEPSSPDARRALAEVHRLRGLAFYLWLGAHPRPRGAPPDAKALAAWEEGVAERRRFAIREFEAALRVDPEGDDAASNREHVEQLRGADPEARRAAVLEAQDRLREGDALREAGKRAEAFDVYRRGAEVFPGFLPLQVRIAEVAVELGAELDDVALAALDVVRDLAPDFVDADFLRAQLFVRRWRASKDPEDASAARRGAERFLSAARARGRPQDEKRIEQAERILEMLEQGR